MQSKSRLVATLILAVLTLGLIWPALYNGEPFFFADTVSYMRSADAAASKLLHKTTPWSGANVNANAAFAAPASATQASEPAKYVRTRSLADASKRGILSGRSIYYGALLYLSYISSHFWLQVIFQALLVLAAVALILRDFRYPLWPNLGAIGAGLIVFSDAPFFASMLMPDIFAAFAILGCAVLLSRAKLASKLDTAAWFVLISISILFHDSCLLITVSMFGIASIEMLLRKRWRMLPHLGLLVCTFIVGMAGHAAFTKMVIHATGAPPLRYPFITARLQSDGPATRYLNATCPQSKFAACEFKARFPMPVDQFLLAEPKDGGLFYSAPIETRRALGEEQMRLGLAVFRYDPKGVIGSVLRNMFGQLTDFRLYNFNYPNETGISQILPASELPALQKSAAFRGTMHIAVFTAVTYASAIGSLLYVLWALRFSKVSGKREWSPVALWTLAGLILNAAICAGMSGVFARFQARVIWLLPLLVLLLEIPHRFKQRVV